ncbi:DUF3349 domain-containing protein [Hymenobacter cellulosivorans]|uniref:DUF3349 domain-containing protein n=1 Tax=Hymenobacter cellulosivorans TaxID=2932249 RepID=A0ABY4F5I7_9BACT|nr:DUF3349 domain-containing protein [Hymenobacter cellulosivorans]UOQ51739.1 DUF3349 domain-containing protein [Hymenobacter cellulosivorans]
MEEKIAPELRSTYIMLKAAFPDGVSPEEYFALIHYLYEGMSDRQLAQVVGLLIGQEDYVAILNDVYKVHSLDAKLKSNKSVYDRLVANGYNDWLEEQ